MKWARGVRSGRAMVFPVLWAMRKRISQIRPIPTQCLCQAAGEPLDSMAVAGYQTGLPRVQRSGAGSGSVRTSTWNGFQGRDALACDSVSVIIW